MTEKYKNCIVTEPKIIDQFDAHVPGKYQILMDNELVPGADFFIAGGIHHKIHQAEPISHKHTHDQSEVYLYISKKGDAEIEVELEDETYRMTTPCSVYVPKGVKHTYRYLRIDGPLTVVAIVRHGEYIPKK
ncbi:MAG: cupin domain-containing protein [Deltaproteobacteria bacterium]|nr:cupin domain-containing protein [Deltaproteobacteria bacterium]